MNDSSDEYESEHLAEERPLNLVLTNKIYDLVKFCILVLFPAFGALYFAIVSIWEWPVSELTIGAIMLIDTVLGVGLGLSSKQYKNETQGPTVGFMIVTRTDKGNKNATLEFPGDPNTIDQHDKVTFKVIRR